MSLVRCMQNLFDAHRSFKIVRMYLFKLFLKAPSQFVILIFQKKFQIYVYSVLLYSIETRTLSKIFLGFFAIKTNLKNYKKFFFSVADFLRFLFAVLIIMPTQLLLFKI